ncbi:hypothetical protein EQG63_06625 [Flavobacterium amnicola]|uniref:Uncharacterized protein n=1 Tax=Flavobacterium amnicola TaxID=2506422 RepID=A0A4Q1K2T3_9FLAO|nr:ankyrin repeat domain-containing protein [Flavobacterium amnicola]RXR19114.1 hypothetical protein EQG63_06625 [Flavobacterium amnicola]
MKITLKYNTVLIDHKNSSIVFDNELQNAVKKLNESKSEIHQWIEEDLENAIIINSKIEFKVDIDNNSVYCVITYSLEESISEIELEKLIESTSDQLIDGYGEKDWEIKYGNNYITLEIDHHTQNVYPFEIKQIESKKNELKAGIIPNNYAKKIEKAVETGKIEIVQKYLKEGGDIDYVGKWEQTLLMKAIQSNQEEIALLLIHNGADINKVDDENNTALFKTAFYGLTKTAQILIEKGANVNALCRNGWTTLMMASNRKQFNLVKLLVENGADIFIEDDYGHTALDTTDREIFVYLKELKSKLEVK